MRKLLLVLGIVFTVLGIAFTILPMDTLAFLPIGIAIFFVLITLRKSEDGQKKLPNYLLIVSVFCSMVVIGKTLFIEDKVEKDVQFEKQKIETKKEAKKELEELEGLE